MKKLLLMSAVALSLTAAPAFAHDGPGGPGGPDPHHHCMAGRHHGHGMDRMFDKMDANHDGKISRAEFMAAQARRFDQMDLNHDGFISKGEMHEFMKHKMEMMHRRFGQEGGWRHEGPMGDHGPDGGHGPRAAGPAPSTFQSGVGYKAPQTQDYSHANDDDAQ